MKKPESEGAALREGREEADRQQEPGPGCDKVPYRGQSGVRLGEGPTEGESGTMRRWGSGP